VRGKHLLLILDNCEHLVQARAELVEALLASSEIRVVATSRKALRVAGETAWRVPSLTVPTSEGRVERHTAAASAAQFSRRTAGTVSA
jgi:non-specific serine/threonine protein kinase